MSTVLFLADVQTMYCFLSAATRHCQQNDDSCPLSCDSDSVALIIGLEFSILGKDANDEHANASVGIEEITY